MNILEVKNVRAGYDPEVDVLCGVSLEIADMECVAMIGANGAGKSSLLKSISGIVKIKSGEILFRGERIDNLQPHQIVEKGIIQVPEEGGTFDTLTIEENLNISCHRKIAKEKRKENIETVYHFFPILKTKRNDLAKSLSGGQRKMLAVGKAIMGCPELLLLDDISMGLAPKVVEELYDMLKKLTNQLNVPVIIVEQIVEIALDFAERGYVMTQGNIALKGSSQELLQTEEVKKIYIGM
ncbi:ABC transporter ATP-binding protein [Acidaminobacter hydrogenoformans]|uniref:Branched-chain amino acid transport system ATP-binding protein n=1 Tax=Acidaminobacter hydrogenoformans DSM 2784 TaxID=1120920 RepID=A0A1G5S163_9FIRM|nr:ABC transporter ATP-binding protein [Acidaminobacter hydrogenoformans]SCZ79867.1 branched-chain amino acid transport system ATP-binding protein [Acidaminobacter hydrogenoformans DSM 2784]